MLAFVRGERGKVMPPINAPLDSSPTLAQDVYEDARSDEVRASEESRAECC